MIGGENLERQGEKQEPQERPEKDINVANEKEMDSVPRRKKVSFWATAPVKSKVSFRTSSGKKVTFRAKVPKKKKVTFYR